ncbi:transcription initiation factor IIB [Halobaculum limi]|uniref:transcription initiation factor IIB n=1 Tax=Halobaculum limi TaxID=3031916 RepID=UPI003D80CF36
MAYTNYDQQYDDEQGGNLSEGTRCPECDGHLQTEGGETACLSCGLLLDEYRYDHGATPRSYADSETDREHVGAPLTETRHDRGISTAIGRTRDSNGGFLTARKRRQLRRLRREHSRGLFASTAERNLATALSEIARLTSALELPRSAREVASRVYREAQARSLIPGRSIEEMAAASVYAACRCSAISRSVVEIASYSHVSESAVYARYRVLNKELELEAAPPRPEETLTRVASTLEIADDVRARAGELISALRAVKAGSGCNPAGIAAGCLYVAVCEFSQSITQHEIAAAAGVTAVTLRARAEDLKQVEPKTTESSLGDCGYDRPST